MSNKGKYESDNLLKQRLLNRFLAKVRKQTASPEGIVLDVGGGEGLFWDPAPTRLCAIDIRKDALAEGRSNTGWSPVLADAYRMPFLDDTFDLVVAIEVLEHLQDPAAALDEIARVAQSRVVITVPWEPFFSLGVLLGSGQHARRLGREPEHVQAFGPRDIEALLRPRFERYEVMTVIPWIMALASKSG